MSAKKIKARRMILLHEKLGLYSDYTLQPDATDAHFAKLAAECCNRKAILSPVFVLPATREAYEQMVNAIADKMFACAGYRGHGYLQAAADVLAALNIKEPKP